MGRKILFITTDQMRYDALGCTGGRVARTPALDGLAAAGILYHRAHGQSVICMPSRATIMTGQHVRTHGVWTNGVPLPLDAPNVADYLNRRGGYRTALIGKAHFEPWLVSDESLMEGRLADEGSTGPYRGFEHLELANHFVFLRKFHYDQWVARTLPEHMASFYPIVRSDLQQNEAGGGDTNAPQVWHNAIPREAYHTDWVADRTIAYLDGLPDDADWFVWMSFPDPHHPWDPPASELGRVDWRDVPLPEGYPGSAAAARALLERKPRHWLDYFDATLNVNVEAPPGFVPAALIPDQVREVNAMTHIENELIDEACGRVLVRIRERGWDGETDVIFTTDHGELQGDFGLLFKGPYHVDALMRLPMFWRPAPTAGIAPAAVAAPVGQLDLAPTFCEIAGLPVPAWMEGQPLPLDDPMATDQGRERVITEWDSDYNGHTVTLRSLYRDGYVCTAYEAGTLYDGTEGELYDLGEDPLQHHNLWDDPARRALKADLLADLRAHLPPARAERLLRVAAV